MLSRGFICGALRGVSASSYACIVTAPYDLSNAVVALENMYERQAVCRLIWLKYATSSSYLRRESLNHHRHPNDGANCHRNENADLAPAKGMDRRILLH